MMVLMPVRAFAQTLVQLVKRLLLILVIGAFFLVGGFGYLMFADRSVFQSGLASYEGLPSSASDISVYRNPNISGYFVADFRIPEADWMAFCSKKGWDLAPIQGARRMPIAASFVNGQKTGSAVIMDGLHFSRLARNGGGVEAAYDRTSGRAYISRSNR